MGTVEGAAAKGPAENIASISMAFGLAIAVLVHTFGHISGAHLNPAVTWALAITGKIEPLLAVLYVLVQLVGGILGAALVYATTEDVSASCNTTTNTTSGKAFGRETILTFLLVRSRPAK